MCVSFPLKYFLNHQWFLWQELISECFVHAKSTKSQTKFQSHILHHPSLLFHHLSKCKYCNVSFNQFLDGGRSPPGNQGVSLEISVHVCDGMWFDFRYFCVKSLICKWAEPFSSGINGLYPFWTLKDCRSCWEREAHCMLVGQFAFVAIPLYFYATEKYLQVQIFTPS